MYCFFGQLRYETSFGSNKRDDLTVADWKVGTKGNITAPFTFTKYEFLDTIEAV